jgi:hypothetical protein
MQHSAFLAAYQVNRLKDEGKTAPEMISMVKRQNCDRVLANACTLQEVISRNAASDEYHIGRHVGNLFVAQVLLLYFAHPYRSANMYHRLMKAKATFVI